MMNTYTYGGLKTNYPDRFNYFVGTGDAYLTTILTQMAEQSECEYDGKRFVFDCSEGKLSNVMESLAKFNVRNSFLELIESQEWDGKPRLRGFLKSIGCGISIDRGIPELAAKEDRYLEEVGQSFILIVLEKQYMWKEDVSKFPRRKPKFIPTFMGTQDAGKSLIVETIGLGRYGFGPLEFGWNKTTTESIRDEREFRYTISGGLITELAEGVSLEDASEDKCKAELEKFTSTYRAKFEKNERLHTINQTYVITSNDYELLKDLTGGSRYYPIYIDYEEGSHNLKYGDYATPHEMLQIYAEALVLYKKGVRWDTAFNSDAELKSIVKAVQRGATFLIPGMLEIRAYLDRNFSEIGDRVSRYAIATYVRDQLGYHGAEVDNLVNQFKQASESLFGFRYRKQLWVELLPDDDDRGNHSGFERIREVSDEEND